MNTRNITGYKMARIAPKMYSWYTKLAKTQNITITAAINQGLEDAVKLQTKENLK